MVNIVFEMCEGSTYISYIFLNNLSEEPANESCYQFFT